MVSMTQMKLHRHDFTSIYAENDVIFSKNLHYTVQNFENFQIQSPFISENNDFVFWIDFCALKLGLF